MSRMITMGPDLTMPADLAVTQTFGALAVRGAGKSNLAAVMAEGLHAANQPFVVIDPTSTWWGLRSSQDGTGPGLPIVIFGGPKGDLRLEANAGAEIADLVAEKRLSCVLDVFAFGTGQDSERSKIRFLTEFAERLYRKNEQPLHIFCEEIDDYAPQKPRSDQARLLGAWQNIVRRGRARGLGMTMITQRSAVVNKDLLTQVETLFVLRTTNPWDQKAIAGWVKYHGESEDILSSLNGLANGEAWCLSPNFLGFTKRVHIRRRLTFDSAATPKGNVARRAPATLADVDLEQIRIRMAATIERAKADDPKELRKKLAEKEKRIAELERGAAKAPAPAAVAKPVELVSPKAAKALEAAAGKMVVTAEKLEAQAFALRAAGQGLDEKAAMLRIDAHGITAALARAKGGVPIAPAGPQGGAIAAPVPRQNGRSQAPAARESGNGSLKAMPRAFLTALAQHQPNSLSKTQLLILADYRACGAVSRMFASMLHDGWVEQDGPGRLRITPSGLTILGPFEPLPTGAALRDYLIAKGSPMEGAFLRQIFGVWPQPISKRAILDATGYSACGAVSRTFAKIVKVGWVMKAGQGQLKANDDLWN